MTAAGRGPGPDGTTALTGYLVLLLLIPAPMVVGALGQVGGPATLFALACFVWWAWDRIHQLGDPAREGGRDGWVRAAGLLFLVVVLVVYTRSAGLALPPAERSPADGALLRNVGLVGLVCVAADGVVDRERLWSLARRAVLLLGAVCLLSAVQIATGEVWVDRISLPGLSAPQGLELIQRGTFLRTSGTSTHPIEFSAVLAMMMPLAFAVAARERRRPWLFRAVAAAAPVLLLMNGSRTALVCGLLAFVVMMTSWGRTVRLVASGALLAVLAVMFVTMPGFIGSLRGLFVGASEDPSVTSRTDSWAMVGEYWSRHPWLGRGVGTFLPEYWILDNQYLNLLVGGGVVTLAALLLLFGTAVRAGVGAARVADDPHDRQLAVALVAGVSAGALSWALFDAAAFPQAAGALFVLIGMCGAVHRAVVPAPQAGRTDHAAAG